MTLDSKTFDNATAAFTAGMAVAQNWKHHYFGAAYSTRLRQAIRDARDACDQMEKIINKDEA